MCSALVQWCTTSCFTTWKILDVDNSTHPFCLHYIFLPRTNDSLHHFVQSWNNHPLSKQGSLSPNQLWLTGNYPKVDDTGADNVEVHFPFGFVYSRSVSCMYASLIPIPNVCRLSCSVERGCGVISWTLTEAI